MSFNSMMTPVCAATKANAERMSFEAHKVVASIQGEEVTIEQLRKAFDEVCDPADWKAPVNAILVDGDDQRLSFRAALAREAVCFYHGQQPKVMNVGRRTMQIIGRGYVC